MAENTENPLWDHRTKHYPHDLIPDPHETKPGPFWMHLKDVSELSAAPGRSRWCLNLDDVAEYVKAYHGLTGHPAQLRLNEDGTVELHRTDGEGRPHRFRTLEEFVLWMRD